MILYLISPVGLEFLSWGSVYFKTNKITCLDLLEYDNL